MTKTEITETLRWQAAISLGSVEQTMIVEAVDEQDAILRIGIMIGKDYPTINTDGVSIHAIQSEEVNEW